MATDLAAAERHILSQETAQVEDSHPRGSALIPKLEHYPSLLVCSAVRQLSKSQRDFGNRGAVFSMTYEWRPNCHFERSKL